MTPHYDVITVPFHPACLKHESHDVSSLQVMQQFPLSFEFNERLLHTLFVHSYYSVYGKPVSTTCHVVSCQTLASYPGLLAPAFVACSTNAGEGLVKLSHMQ